MTRPKVDPDKRQRTACACDSCKRRKQKCNGHNPCNTCVKRHLICVYTPALAQTESSQSPVASPTKRRHVDSSPTALDLEDSRVHTKQNSLRPSAQGSWATESTSGMSRNKVSFAQAIGAKPRTLPDRGPLNDDLDPDARSGMGSSAGPADEAEAYPSSRMLQDSTGRLLYVGDSATLSFLQLIRMLVESVAGKSKFTMDPNRHMIVEARIDLPPSDTPPGILPDRRTAEVLVESYFTNTIGLAEVFDRRNILHKLNQCYQDPLTVDKVALCHLNLIFAIGLVLSRATPGSEEDTIIRKLRENKEVNRAEVFFRNAKDLADPVSGLEDADFWSVQALLLMAIYMLSVSRRNAAYAYYGMAVRSAFALGLHQEENLFIFSALECKVRRNLWRTLYVLDRFLAASLGRPTSIYDEDCSEHALDAPQKSFDTEAEEISSAALDAAVKSSRVIGKTLKEVYSRRKISTTVAQDIAETLKEWSQLLNPALQWQHAATTPLPPSHGIASLHVNLLQCHSVILLARPFFLFILKAGVTQHKPTRLSLRMESFAQTCIEAAQHTLAVAHTALQRNHLSQCNPFVIYCVFAAGLIILSNEFASLYKNPDAGTAISHCIAILKYCAEIDPQAQRVVYIIEVFHEANLNRPDSARTVSFLDRKIPVIQRASMSSQRDPMTHFFAHTRNSPEQHFPTLAPSLKHRRPSIPSAHANSIPPAVPLVLQQPSPDASGASPGGAAVPTPMPSTDPLHGQEIGFSFDELWPPAWHPHGAMATEQHAEPVGVFNHYSLAPAPIPIGNPHAANVNAALYPNNSFQ